MRPLKDFSHRNRQGLTCLLPVLRPLDDLAPWESHILKADKRDARVTAATARNPIQIQAHPEPRQR